MIEGYQAINHDNEMLIILVQMIAQSQQDLPCFKRGVNQTINELKERIAPQGSRRRLTKQECAYEVDKLIR